jgi:hypothetical protein
MNRKQLLYMFLSIYTLQLFGNWQQNYTQKQLIEARKQWIGHEYFINQHKEAAATFDILCSIQRDNLKIDICNSTKTIKTYLGQDKDSNNSVTLTYNEFDEFIENSELHTLAEKLKKLNSIKRKNR